MPKQTKVLSYEDRKYQQKKNLYDSLHQAFQNVKYEYSSNFQWNKPIELMKGLTMRMVGTQLQLTEHRLETGTVEMITRKKEDGKSFLKGIEKALKKEFRRLTGKNLELKKIEERQNIEAHSKIAPATSWLYSGYGSRPVARYLISDSLLYDFDASL